MRTGFFIAICIVFSASFVTGIQLSAGEESSHSRKVQNSEVHEIEIAVTEAFRKGDYGTAIPLLQILASKAPDTASFHARLGQAFYSTGRPRDAIPPLRKALELDPACETAHHFLGLSLAESGNCKEALAILESDYPQINDRALKRRIGLAGERCARSAEEPYRGINYLQWLNRDFPNDPEVLYLSTHVFSDLSTRASQRLLRVAPDSRRAHQLYAEILEVQGRNAESIAEYRKVLATGVPLPTIHYQIGRLLLAGDSNSASLDAARKEFEQELEINPTHMESEYELGEITYQARHWNEAIEHFGRAVKIEPNASKALIGLGKSLVSAGRLAEALPPLEKAVQLAPDDAAAHYQISFAYLRVGRKQEAEKHLALYREAHDQQQRVSRVGGVDGSSPTQTTEPQNNH